MRGTQGALPLAPMLRRLKELFEKSSLRILKNFSGKLSAEFLTVLFFPNRTVFPCGAPAPHVWGTNNFALKGQSRTPVPTGLYAAPKDSLIYRTGLRGHTRLRTTPRNSSEAASLKSLGPYGQKAHKPRGYIGGCFPLCTFSLVRFFDVCQRNEHIE